MVEPAHSLIAPTEIGCPAREVWERFWRRLPLPLTGDDLAGARQLIAIYADPDDPQGTDGDCSHCVEQVERLIRLVEEAEA